MEWDSPWGKGFPGWHLECSTIAMKYLGETLDIHTGGIDHIAIHHTNEIAQSEGATGKPFAKYWLHAEFLTVDGGRMGKSLGNAYTLHDIKTKDLNPLALRYLFLTAHYRSKQNFTWEALNNAQTSLLEFYRQLGEYLKNKQPQQITVEQQASAKSLTDKFAESLANDLNAPQALAVAWETLKEDLTPEQKVSLLAEFDKVLGLELIKGAGSFAESLPIPDVIQDLIQQREKARQDKDFPKADRLRQEIEKQGLLIEDTESGPRLHRRI